MASSTTRHRSLGRIDRGAHVTAVAASHTSGKKITPKKNRGAIFFWRRPLRVTARLDESTGPRTSQLAESKFRKFFGIFCPKAVAKGRSFLWPLPKTDQKLPWLFATVEMPLNWCAYGPVYRWMVFAMEFWAQLC